MVKCVLKLQIKRVPAIGLACTNMCCLALIFRHKGERIKGVAYIHFICFIGVDKISIVSFRKKIYANIVVRGY